MWMAQSGQKVGRNTNQWVQETQRVRGMAGWTREADPLTPPSGQRVCSQAPGGLVGPCCSRILTCTRGLLPTCDRGSRDPLATMCCWQRRDEENKSSRGRSPWVGLGRMPAPYIGVPTWLSASVPACSFLLPRETDVSVAEVLALQVGSPAWPWDLWALGQ